MKAKMQCTPKEREIEKKTHVKVGYAKRLVSRSDRIDINKCMHADKLDSSRARPNLDQSICSSTSQKWQTSMELNSQYALVSLFSMFGILLDTLFLA